MTDLRELYAAVPAVHCKGLCHDQCTIIPLAPAERVAIESHTGRRVKTLPMVKSIVMRPADDGLTCRYLKRERCSIYEARPMICRLYGAAEGLACPHGCRPLGGLLAGDVVRDLLAQLDELPGRR
jgi:Fe-S-cluster containining protein